MSFTCGPVLRQALAAWACLALLSACSTQSIENFYDSKLTPDRPIDWWHQLSGGPVAQIRPPPPGVDDPYPNFSAIPPKPVPLDPATRRALLARMLAQRDLARRDTIQAPVVWPVPGVPPSPAAQPAKPAAKPPTTPAAAPTTTPTPSQTASADTSSMVFDAPAAPAKPAAPAPSQVDRTPPTDLAAPLGPAAVPVTSGPIPGLPTAAPALPDIPGLPIAQPIPEAAPPTLPSARIAFAPGSATLPPEADAALRSLAARRATATVVVHAGGDAHSAAIAAQQAALPLALQRTGAITAALIAAGVPSAAIRAEAVAEGRDATARLLN